MRSPIESGSPRVETDGFRRSLAEFATGVTVITTSVDGERFGLTSNSFASVSLDPPLVLWSIRRESKSFAAFTACSHFAVNILAEDQIELSQRFARSGPDKFRELDCLAGEGDAPLFATAAASFECVCRQTYDGGDHLILIGEVLRYSRYERRPLLFVKGGYAVSAEHPDMRTFVAGRNAECSDNGEERVLSNLMIRAYSAIASRLERGRQMEGLGLTLMQARLLRAAATSPDRTLDDLMPELFLDFNASRNLLESLMSLGLVAVDDRGQVRLTAEGEGRLQAIVAHARANEDILFKGIPDTDLATVRRVLNMMVAKQLGAPASALQ
ncbi:flavin reductase [Bradyrhizobium manausense]|uniref:flavin reductase n=1 Tax=Bradyrhizobium manausense TaxID=989370 RepID=UPI001BADD12D|nr:flavin reductase [Bradyrhizobium manausense]MBR0832227.1 flavin reductase [Bradyrhizobium manausense]